MPNVDQQGEYIVPAAQADVWLALNDPEVLARCIPGCLNMTRDDPAHFSARVKAKVGPVSATFDVALELQDVHAPDSYRIDGQVKGGPAGFGRGGATVRLTSLAPLQTRLLYEVQASIGGKLAQVGSRLIDSATRKMADEFFANFSAIVGGTAAADATTSTLSGDSAETSPGETPSVYQESGQWRVWFVVFALLVVAMLLAL
jgi:uncharacterized protein